ncbi:ArgE/DapE family deacylase [Sphaerobacter sp.]|uniref:ArgE/DapE family deacylase n=1 Tax=Sphaerobacter sp. TaxID=2099654 RepID=UPI001D23B422|nr:ArgE/DapE family deacylase [Sphaerobacter sp.]MBX5446358.1 ArgE/DapE family deacylase [Sphaerobacter sp.]
MIQIDPRHLRDALADLVRIPSINPDLVPGAGGEREIAEAIAARLRATPGITVELQDAGNGRPNVIATVGEGAGRRLMLNGHMDTVGVAGMTDPFSPRVEDDRLYGRGAFDMKGSLAGMIVLLEAIARAGDFPGQLIATFVVDEEYASIGTQAICREIDRWRPDAALVLEPTELEIGVAHKGFVWAEIVTHGRAAHGSDFRAGVDAIVHMGRVLVELERLGADLLARPPHRYVGPPSIHASLISGGQELSSYPEECRLQIERRTVPGETAAQVEAELQAILDRLSAADEQFKATLTMGVVREPFEISENAEIVRVLGRAVERELGQEPVIYGGFGWMDSALLAAAGVPTAIFGPSGDGAHALVEWSDLASLETFTRVLTRVVYDFCAT